MKVIKRVDPVVEFTLECHCFHCGSDLEIDAGDLQHQPASSDPREHDPERFFVTCEVCTENVYVDSAKVPTLVKKRTRGKGTSCRGSNPYR